MARSNGKQTRGARNGKRYCCYIAEMLEECGVTRRNVLETKKLVLRAINAFIEAEIEHIEMLERRAAEGPGPTAVPLSSFKGRRRSD